MFNKINKDNLNRLLETIYCLLTRFTPLSKGVYPHIKLYIKEIMFHVEITLYSLCPGILYI